MLKFCDLQPYLSFLSNFSVNNRMRVPFLVHYNEDTTIIAFYVSPRAPSGDLLVPITMLYLISLTLLSGFAACDRVHIGP